MKRVPVIQRGCMKRVLVFVYTFSSKYRLTVSLREQAIANHCLFDSIIGVDAVWLFIIRLTPLFQKKRRKIAGHKVTDSGIHVIL